MKVKNRIVMAPLGVPRIASRPGGYLTNQYLACYEARAKGGVGLIQSSVSALGHPWASGLFWAPGSLSIVDDEHIDSARRFVDAIHSHGTKLSFQITHHGVVLSTVLERIAREKLPEKLRIVAPSAVPFAQTGFVPHALTRDEIQDIIEAFGQAARRGKIAGFDAVRIQACHGYLLHQFLSPRTNRRKDDYGGSIENRARIVCEIVRQVRKNVGSDYPIIVRMNGDDFLEGGITLDQSVQHARFFVEAGAECLDVSSGPLETHHWQFVTMYQPSGPLIPIAATIKKAAKVPVIVAGKIDPILAERALEEGSADFIHFGRPLIADPDLPEKVRQGRLEDIRPCIYCDECHRLREDSTYCSVNPAFGKELEYKIEPTQQIKNVMVIGGGLAGMQAARILAERGHRVSLFERQDRLGGQWNILSAYKPEQQKLVIYLSRGLEKAGVKVYLNQEVTDRMVEEMKPDAVVVATGAVPTKPSVSGINGKNVVLANDVLSGKVQVGQETVVIGGHLVGLDVALSLAEQGKKVSVVEMRKIAWDVSHNLKLALLEYLIKYDVRMFPDSIIESVTNKGVQIIWDGGEPAVKGGPRYELRFLKADTVIIATGSKSDSNLGERLGGLRSEVYTIGDCMQPRDVMAAIHEGTAVGRRI